MAAVPASNDVVTSVLSNKQAKSIPFMSNHGVAFDCAFDFFHAVFMSRIESSGYVSPFYGF